MRKPQDITIVFDFDGVICANNQGNYEDAPPYPHAIENINKVYDMGYNVTICTARYGYRNPGYQYQYGYEEALVWLRKNGVKFHHLIMGKPHGDLFVDDRACIVQSENGTADWDNNFWPMLEIIGKKDIYGEEVQQHKEKK